MRLSYRLNELTFLLYILNAGQWTQPTDENVPEEPAKGNSNIIQRGADKTAHCVLARVTENCFPKDILPIMV